MLMMVRPRKMLALLCLAGMPAAHALSSLDDAALSDATGQSGMSITISPLNPPAFGLATTDSDGVPGVGASAGTVYLRGINFATSGNTQITIDAGSNASLKPVLAVALSTPSLNLGLSGTASPALGFNVLADACPGSAACTLGAAGDAPLFIMPASGSGLSLSVSSLSLLLQLGDYTGSTIKHLGVLTDSGPIAVTIGNTATVGLAVVDNANVKAATTVVGGVGFGSVNLTGVDLGTNSASGNYTALDICPASGGSAFCTGLGAPGVAMTFYGNAMSNINVQVNNMTAGNIGDSLASVVVAGTTYPMARAMPNYGSLKVQGLSLAGASLLVSGH